MKVRLENAPEGSPNSSFAVYDANTNKELEFVESDWDYLPLASRFGLIRNAPQPSPPPGISSTNETALNLTSPSGNNNHCTKVTMKQPCVAKTAHWTYKGITVFPASINSSGIRWCARPGTGITLKADTKQGMRQLISQRV